eukprot:2273743-Alexandrium_andersonii.AAC.1
MYAVWLAVQVRPPCRGVVELALSPGPWLVVKGAGSERLCSREGVEQLVICSGWGVWEDDRWHVCC